MLCALLGISSSGYYAWRERQHTPRPSTDLRLLTKMRAAHAENCGVYGSRRMQVELVADGESVGRAKVRRLMREHGLQARKARRFKSTTDSKHDDPIAPNLLMQDFAVDAPNTVWAAEITYVWTAEGWSYLAVVVDLCARRVVGWAMADHMRTELPMQALTRAIEARRPNAGLIHHSDRGSQYASTLYRSKLRDHEVAQSMSRAGDCYDNAAVESFFASLKKECTHRRHFASHTEAYDAVVNYIDNLLVECRRRGL
ncbi:MAG: IS3 family transposase [Sandaracinaceae bacterium]|nr:IS3 family transposase [Sandaracinaceae bacterium]